MPATVIVGSQFGDEGKGKITDFFAKDADVVVRYQGGNNAGHTLKVEGVVVKLHHLPSGVMYGKHVMLGAGVIIDPIVLNAEIWNLKKIGKNPKLFIDPRCHIIMPWHKAMDAASEEGAGIGTTRRGIGPCYADKCMRRGIRFEDLADRQRLKQAIDAIFPEKKKTLEMIYGFKVDFTAESTFAEYAPLGERFSGMLKDVSFHVTEMLNRKKEVLFEGAQGTFLDNDFGTYPYVTSSHPISGGVSVGVGVPINKINKVIGIVKAYTTRVGNGPFPTELTGKEGDRLREKGKEIGATTGRNRRVGWLDLPMLRTSARINGYTELAITKLDVLSGFEKLKVCTDYGVDKKKVKFFPYSTSSAEKAKPVYREMKGFVINGAEKKFKELERNAQEYVQMIEMETGVPVKIVSIGAERKETILR